MFHGIFKRKYLPLYLLGAFLLILSTYFALKSYNQNNQDSPSQVTIQDSRPVQMAALDDFYGAYNRQDYNQAVELAPAIIERQDLSDGEKLGVSVLCVDSAVKVNKNNLKEQCYSYASMQISQITNESKRTSEKANLDSLYQGKGMIIQEQTTGE